jgi:polysaccharide deacetylase 2 family uncharacterized protein YibQ
MAQQQGFAVVIGHPYPETLNYLESVLPSLAAADIELVPPSVMIEQLKAALLSPDQP